MDSELAMLMPNNLQHRRGDPVSPVDTGELRRYIQEHGVLADKANMPFQMPGRAQKPKGREYQPGAGGGRVPQAKRFCIRIKRSHEPAPIAQQLFEQPDPVDPEDLKDAMLQQALAQRQALLASTLRAGTGRAPPAVQFSVRIKEPRWPMPPLELDPEPQPDPEPEPEPELQPEPSPQVERAPVLAATQMGQAKTPGDDSDVAQQYPSPMEGVLERPTGRGEGQAATSAGQVGLLPPTGRGATPVGSNEQPAAHGGSAGHAGPEGGDTDHDSPVEGLVQQGSGQARVWPADAPAAFAFPLHHRPQVLPAFPFPSPPRCGEVGVQTGASLQGSPEADLRVLAAACDAGGGGDDDDDDFGGGLDDGGGFDDNWGDGVGGGEGAGPPGDATAAAGPSPSPAMMPPPAPKPRRRPVLDPGVRLRNENPRRSMAVDPLIGRQEVAPGIRRSMRRHQEPLMWWLGEKKNFSRAEHKTMPTVATVTSKLPNTPWRTVADPREWRRGGRKGRGKERGPRAAAEGGGGQAADSSDDDGGEERDQEDEQQEEMEEEEEGGVQAPGSPADSEATEVMRPAAAEGAEPEVAGGGGSASPQQRRRRSGVDKGGEGEVVDLVGEDEDEAAGAGSGGGGDGATDAAGTSGSGEAGGEGAVPFAPATAPIDDLDGEALLEEEGEGEEQREAAAEARGAEDDVQPAAPAPAAQRRASRGGGRKRRKKAAHK